MKNLTILGSTGSIGTSALRVVEANPERYKVLALGAGRNMDRLTEQIEKFRPLAVAVQDSQLADQLARRFGSGSGPEIYYGMEGFVRLVTLDGIDTVISAMTGAAGLIPTFEAIRAGKNIALANKEPMVAAGPIMMEAVNKKGVSLLPIDSEHSAIFQAFQGHPREDVKRVILTASGGPFREFSAEDLKYVSPEQALNHPNWDMGQKITIDSATLMNKGLEIIEAKWLFDLRLDQIDVLVHPQSIVHSMVEYRDGSIIAQMGIPDMITPISYALSYPHHIETKLPSLQLEKLGMLSFQRPDSKTFKCLDLAMQAARIGDSMPAVLNGANEMAVKFFLEGVIGFLDIPTLIEKTMAAHQPVALESIEAVIEIDQWARTTARSKAKELNGSIL